MKYYELVTDLNDVLDIWRLPKDLDYNYFFDDARKIGIKKAIDAIMHGKNVLITGKLGVGKTAFAFILLKELINRGYQCGILIYGIDTILRDHEKDGVVVFIDDIDDYGSKIIKAIIKMNIKNIVATIDIEKKSKIENELGIRFADYFEIVFLPPWNEDSILENIENIEEKTGVKIPAQEAQILAEKSKGALLYIIHALEIFRMMGISKITQKHLEKLPTGVEELTEYALWEYLDNLPADKRKVVLLLLMTLGDVPGKFLHEDILYALYAIFYREINNKNVSITDLILNVNLEKELPFLVRIKKYFLGVKHPVWIETINMSKRLDIMALRSMYPKERRLVKLKEAINLARRQIVPLLKEDKNRSVMLEWQAELLIMEKKEEKEEIKRTLSLTKISIPEKSLAPINIAPLEEFLVNVAEIAKRVLPQNLLDLLALILADFIKARKLMILPINIEMDIIKDIIEAKLEGKYDSNLIRRLLSLSQASIFIEECAVLKYGYDMDIDLSLIQDKINYSRLALRLLIIGKKASEILQILFDNLSIDSIIDLAIRASYIEKSDITKLISELKKADPQKALVLAMIATRDIAKINRFWTKIEKTIKILYQKLLYQSLLADTIDQQTKVLSEATALSYEEAVEFLENLITINYYRKGHHEKEILEYGLGLTHLYPNNKEKIKLKLVEAIAKTQYIELARDILSELIENRALVKRDFLQIGKILGLVRDYKLLGEILQYLSDTKKYKVIEMAILNSILTA